MQNRNEISRVDVRPAALMSSAFNCLPADMMSNAVTRLGWLAFFYAISLQVVHWGRHFSIQSDNGGSLMYIGLFGGTAAGILVACLAWNRKLSPSQMLDLGLVFEVIGALCIGVIEYSMSVSIPDLIHGWSAIVLWIAFFVLVVPATLGKTALAATASVLMGPAAFLLFSTIQHQPAPDLAAAGALFIPHFLFAGLAIVLSRFVYSLGTDLNKARAVGSYELIELLGRGGMGEVWKAKHRMLARPAALKLISCDAVESGRPELATIAVRRFEQEAQATASLRSPNTVHIYDFGVTGQGSLYYAMELLDGLDLQTLVERHGPLPAERAVHFLRGMALSLEEAHSVGLVHRDIKPANIYASRQGLEYDFVKVLDFGLARFNDSDSTRLTISGITSGTPAYIAPEVALGMPEVDGRADIYALGCVGYWLLTGKLPFDADTALGMIFHHVNSVPVLPSKSTETVIPPALERLIMDCLEKDPSKRPANARVITNRLESIREREWTRDRAERWWQTHCPDIAAGSAKDSGSGDRESASHAQRNHARQESLLTTL